MVGPFPGVPYSFGALRETFGPLFVRCDVCRRYARLYLADIRDTDYRTKTFSCCRCGTDGALAITEPNTETGMTDYQLDQVEGPQHHPGALARLTGTPKACISSVWEALWGKGPYSLKFRLCFAYSRQGLRLPLRKGLPPP
jgi:hypothetical protein